MSKITDAANNMFAAIGAVQTLVENFPMNLLSFVDVKFNSSFELISILFKILGISREDVIEMVTHALCGKMKDDADGNGFISQVEEIVKLILETNIASTLNCTTNPVIPNNLLDNYSLNSGTPMTGEGIVLDVSEVDLTGVLNRSPFMPNGDKFYFDVEGYNVNSIYKSKDFNAYLWYIINRSDKSQTTELIWDNRYRAAIYGSGSGVKKEIIKCSYSDGVYPNSDKLIVQICGARDGKASNYYKTRQITVGEKTWELNKTILEFNHDFITSIKLYEPKVIVAEIVEYLIGNAKLYLTLGFSVNEEIIRGKIQQIIRNVITNDDFVVNDCFFSFSNKEYNNMLEISERNRYNMLIGSNGCYEGNSTDILEKLTSITSESTLHEDKAVITSVLSDIIATPAQDPSYNTTGNADLDLQFDLMTALVYPFIRPLFTPKVIFLLMVNRKIMGEPSNINADEILNNLLNVIIKEIIIRLKAILLDMFLSRILKELSPLLGLLASRLLLEALNMYINLLKQIFKCIPIFRFGDTFGVTQDLISTIDDVNYADITNNEKKSPDQTIC